MAFENIYMELMKGAALTEAHQKELIEKRGFSQETIKASGCGSGGPHLEHFEAAALELLNRNVWQERDLVLSGVFIHDGKSVRLNPVLLREKNSLGGKEVSNILIPYLNLEGKPEYVRPHKLGLAGVPILPYQEWNLREDPAEIILTEGEFKAIAAVQYGFPCVGIPGISSFSETKWPELLSLFKKHKVKSIIIMFDNETKDDTNIPHRYKPNPNDRYDTQFYAYYMAKRLEREGGFQVTIATLPDGWKEDGKIDIDGCAAQLKTAGEMKKVLYDAVPRNEFLRELHAEAKQIVLRKDQQKHYRSKIKKEFNRYVVSKTTAKGVTNDIPISNFVMKVVATHETPEGVKREVEFLNEFGRRSASFTIAPEAMSSGDAFRTFALSKGDFIWRGSTDELLTIWESEFLMMDEGRYIIESDHLGWIEREKLWLFGNVAVKADGTTITPDQNGIFWLEKRGVKPISLNIANGKHVEHSGIPFLHTGTAPDPAEIRAKLGETVGKNEALVMLGWITAVAFMEEVFSLYRSFPFLFVTGRWRSGKSTVAEWVTNFFGIEEAGKSISQTTAVAIQRALAYYSCLPVYLDEYRNTKDVAYKNGFLRNVYNRQGAGKGVKDSDYGLRDAKVRGTLIIVGEETPKDGAILSRCIPIFVSAAKRQKDNFEWFMRNRSRFSGFFFGLIKGKHNLVRAFMDSVAEWKAFFIKQGIDDRTALNYATVTAGTTCSFGDDVEFAAWLAKETRLIQVEHNEEQAISVFLDDLSALKTRKLVDENYWHVADGKIYLYFHGLHQVWAQEFRKTRGEEAFKEGSIRAYLKEEKGYLDANVMQRIKGQPKRCVVFDYDAAPDEIKALIDTGDPVGHLV